MKIESPCGICIKSDVCGHSQSVSEWIGEMEGSVETTNPFLKIAVVCEYCAKGKHRGKTKNDDGNVRNIGCGDCKYWKCVRTERPPQRATRYYHFGDCTYPDKQQIHRTEGRREDMMPCQHFCQRETEAVQK